MDEEYDDGDIFPPWDQLIPEVLVLIFNKLSLLEKLIEIPLVCKSWNRVVTAPDCWQDIDFEDTFFYFKNLYGVFEDFDLMNTILQTTVRRSLGQLRSLNARYIVDDNTFSIIAEHAQCLGTLKLPSLWIESSTIEDAAEMLSTVTHLDISYNGYFELKVEAIKAIGYHCKSLEWFNMNMSVDSCLEDSLLDEQAFAIASTMPKLKHLEIDFMIIGPEGLLKILSCCTQLEHLNIRGCFLLNDCGQYFEKFSDLKVVGPQLDT
ncbi:F-box protein FBW2-like [Humulus lupulus]|uniref:F-box protein FBW2-like n=1 Tax=Humulus lupulus TaxID=3486 RepID=UPI002B40251F|nr:F-box protein FBW2-like [Humulus lupulus]